MNNKYFIQGLLYGLSFAESLSKSQDFSIKAHQVMIWFKDGSHLIFAINRGIAHIYGNLAAMLTQEESCNLFDIAWRWVTEAQEKKLSLSFEDGEVRLNLDQLVNVVDSLGEIDYEKTQQEWLKIYLTRYFKQL